MTKTVQYQNELHKFLIWDTAGQERVSKVNICGESLGQSFGCFSTLPQKSQSDLALQTCIRTLLCRFLLDVGAADRFFFFIVVMVEV